MAIRRAVLTGSLFGVEPAQRPFKEGDSQTFKAGAFLVITSGKVVECGADPASILGLAVADGVNNTAAKEVGVFLLTPDSIIEMSVKGTAAANNSAATDVGLAYGVVKDSSGHWVIDKDDVTADKVVISRLVDPAGTANGRVLCHPVLAALQLFKVT